MKKLLISLLLFTPGALALECYQLLIEPVMEETFSLTPTGDFELRDTFPQVDPTPEIRGMIYGKFGPCSMPYPAVVFPAGVDRIAWSRERVIAAARKFVGTPYKHLHAPDVGGVDCSNFSAFVYNYAFGFRFTSSIEKQAVQVGRRLRSDEKFEPGDLLFTYSKDGTRIGHVALYINDDILIDSAGALVDVRKFAGRYKSRFAWATRILE